MKRLNIQPGHRFGRLSVIHETEKRNGKRHFLCKCDCGKTTTVWLSNLTNGHTKSCGCLSAEMSAERKYIHGGTGLRIHRIWTGIKTRCFNKNNPAYKDYGARGITMCEEWLSFESFLKWALDNGYDDSLTIERINNNRGYEPSNCKWISRSEQSKNQRRNMLLTHGDKTLTMSEWARIKDINPVTLWRRINSGWPIERALEEDIKNVRG